VNCREATVFISLHVGDDLPPEQVTALEEHLESCALCDAEYESYAASRDALLSLREDFLALPGHEGVPGASLWEELHVKLEPQERQAAATVGGGGVRRWHQHPFLRGGLAAAVLALLSAPMWMDWSGANNPSGSDLGDFRPLLAGVDLSGVAEDRGLEGQPLQELRADGLGPATESVNPRELREFLQLNQGNGLLLSEQALNPANIAVPVSNPNPNRGSY